MPWLRRLDDAPRAFSDQERATIRLAQQDFWVFLTRVFALSYSNKTWRMADGTRKGFTLSWCHFRWAQIAQHHPRFCVLAPRAHLKSTVLNHALVFWKLFQNQTDMINLEAGMVISFNSELAEAHTASIKEFILLNPYCRFWIDNNPSAKNIVDYTIDFNEPSGPVHRAQVLPFGIMSQMRGRHGHVVVCDDILGDFANPLEPVQLRHIDNIFHQSVESVPDEQDTLGVVGTPQAYEDTLYGLRSNTEYFWARFPAEYGDQRRPLWPEKFDKARLRRTLRRVHERAYQVEYLLVPLQATNSFLPKEIVEYVVDPDLKAIPAGAAFELGSALAVYGGMDVGKEMHPTHISVGAIMPNGDVIQIYQQFLDHMNYNAQAKLVSQLVEQFHVKRFYYDATRGELTDRNMTQRVIGLKMTPSIKGALAREMESRFYAAPDEPGIVLLQDSRQTNQLQAVDRTLKSIETSEGHGDSFWSISLMCKAAKDGPVLEELADLQSMFGLRRLRPPAAVALT